MYKRILMCATLTGLIFAPLMAVEAEEPPAMEMGEAQQPPQLAPPVRGRQMATPEERAEYREKMRNAKTAEERNAIREEHHKKMLERAKELGQSPPEQPGQGPAPGMGGARQGRGGPGR